MTNTAYYLEHLQQHMTWARRDDNYTASHLLDMEVERKVAKLAYRDFGTSRKEVEALQLASDKRLVRAHLIAAREKNEYQFPHLDKLDELLVKTKESFEDIGTTQEEMDALWLSATTAKIPELLAFLREEGRDGHVIDCVPWIEKMLAKTGLRYEDFQTDEAEISRMWCKCARVSLLRARDDTTTFLSEWLFAVESSLYHAKAQPEDIGLPRKEFGEFWLTAAKRHLNELRAKDNLSKSFAFKRLEQTRKRAKVDYKELGTTRKEVAVLRKEAREGL